MKRPLRPATEADVWKLKPLLKHRLMKATRPAEAYLELHHVFRLIGTKLTPPLRTAAHDMLRRLFEARREEKDGRDAIEADPSTNQLFP